MNMVVEGIELPGRCTFADNLKALAKHYIDMGPPALSKEEAERQRYFITDMLDDIREPRSYHELVATGSQLFNSLATYYCRVNGFWAGTGKSIPRVLRKDDVQFYESFSNGFERLFREGNASAVIALAEQTLENSGGLLFDGYSLPAPSQWRKTPV